MSPTLAESSPETSDPVARTLIFAPDDADTVTAATDALAADSDTHSKLKLQRELARLEVGL